MRWASLHLLLLFLLGCTVAVDEFERCEAPSISVERVSCTGAERACTVGCFTTFTMEAERTACLRGCAPGDSPCLECIFGITFECLIDVCAESYQDFSCCSLERCGSVDFDCEACPAELTAFNDCATSVTSSVEALCGNEVVDCYE